MDRNQYMHEVDFRSATQRQTALAHGVDERTIRRWSDMGMPRNKDGTYDIPSTVRWRASATDRQGNVSAFEMERRSW